MRVPFCIVALFPLGMAALCQPEPPGQPSLSLQLLVVYAVQPVFNIADHGTDAAILEGGFQSG